jgi:hypothetical protein
MRASDAFPSKYLKSSDVKAKQRIATISCLETEAVGQDKKKKPVLYFEDDVKPVVVNRTNFEELEAAFGDSDDWAGCKVKIFCAPTSYQGKKGRRHPRPAHRPQAGAEGRTERRGDGMIGVSDEQEYQDFRLFMVFYATTRRLPQEVIEWSQSPEGKTPLEDWEADYRAACARWAEEEAEADARANV